MRASRVALVQLLAALGIVGLDIALGVWGVDGGAEAEEEVFFLPRRVRRRGDALLVLLKLDETNIRMDGVNSHLLWLW